MEIVDYIRERGKNRTGNVSDNVLVGSNNVNNTSIIPRENKVPKPTKKVNNNTSKTFDANDNMDIMMQSQDDTSDELLMMDMMLDDSITTGNPLQTNNTSKVIKGKSSSKFVDDVITSALGGLDNEQNGFPIFDSMDNSYADDMPVMKIKKAVVRHRKKLNPMNVSPHVKEVPDAYTKKGRKNNVTTDMPPPTGTPHGSKRNNLLYPNSYMYSQDNTNVMQSQLICGLTPELFSMGLINSSSTNIYNSNAQMDNINNHGASNHLNNSIVFDSPAFVRGNGAEFTNDIFNTMLLASGSDLVNKDYRNSHDPDPLCFYSTTGIQSHVKSRPNGTNPNTPLSEISINSNFSPSLFSVEKFYGVINSNTKYNSGITPHTVNAINHTTVGSSSNNCINSNVTIPARVNNNMMENNVFSAFPITNTSASPMTDRNLKVLASTILASVEKEDKPMDIQYDDNTQQLSRQLFSSAQKPKSNSTLDKFMKEHGASLSMNLDEEVLSEQQQTNISTISNIQQEDVENISYVISSPLEAGDNSIILNTSQDSVEKNQQTVLNTGVNLTFPLTNSMLNNSSITDSTLKRKRNIHWRMDANMTVHSRPESEDEDEDVVSKRNNSTMSASVNNITMSPVHNNMQLRQNMMPVNDSMEYVVSGKSDDIPECGLNSSSTGVSFFISKLTVQSNGNDTDLSVNNATEVLNTPYQPVDEDDR